VLHCHCVAIYLQVVISVFLNRAPMGKVEDLRIRLCIPFGKHIPLLVIKSANIILLAIDIT